MNYDKERISEMVKALQKEAALAEDKSPDVSPEKQFAEHLTKFASTSGENYQELLEGIQSHITTQEESMNKEAELVGNASAVHPYPADEPQLGKTVTTTNEIPKGNITPNKNAVIEGIIAQLTANKVNHGASTVTIEGAPQTMPIKQAELEKQAAEEMLGRMFTKYASAVTTDEEANTAYGNIFKYASAAEDILEDHLGDGNYNTADIEKVASVMLENDIDDYAEVMQKQAEAEEFIEKTAERTVDLLLEKMAAFSAQENELEKQAEAVTYEVLEKAASMLENTGKPYTEADVVEVAEYLLDQASEPSVVEQALQNG